ncbi:hypothetical protein ACIBF1_01610 [Spirillospora sp. NPDC050679]
MITPIPLPDCAHCRRAVRDRRHRRLRGLAREVGVAVLADLVIALLLLVPHLIGGLT